MEGLSICESPSKEKETQGGKVDIYKATDASLYSDFY